MLPTESRARQAIRVTGAVALFPRPLTPLLSDSRLKASARQCFPGGTMINLALSLIGAARMGADKPVGRLNDYVLTCAARDEASARLARWRR